MQNFHPSIEMCIDYFLNLRKLNLPTVPATTTDSQEVICSNKNSNKVVKPPQLTTDNRKDIETNTKRKEKQNQYMKDYRARKKEEEMKIKEQLKVLAAENANLKIENLKLRKEIQSLTKEG